MLSSLRLASCFYITVSLLAFPLTSFSAGLTTHAFMADRAIDQLDTSHEKPLKRLMEAHRTTVMAASTLPDSAYVNSIFSPAPSMGDLRAPKSFGISMHGDRFVVAYANYIRDVACSNQLSVILAGDDTESHCARLVAHMLGVAAHGIGDEVWDFQFETVVTERDLLGDKNSVKGLGNTVPEQIENLSISFPPMSEEGLGELPFVVGFDGCDSQEDNCQSLIDYTRNLHNADPSRNIEFNMDIANIVRFDRYDDITLLEDYSNETATGESEEIIQSLMAMIGDGMGSPDQPQNYSPLNKVVSTPPYDDLIAVLDSIGESGVTPTDIAVASTILDFTGLVERIVSPYEGERVQQQLPWGWNNVLLASGGVIDSSKVIANYWRSIWRRLAGTYDGPSVIYHHPNHLETNVPTGRFKEFFTHPNLQIVENTTQVISATVDTAFDERSVPIAFKLFDQCGREVPARYRPTHFGADLPNDERNSGRRQFYLSPLDDLLPGHLYTAVVSTALRDNHQRPIDGDRLSRTAISAEQRYLKDGFYWQFTTVGSSTEVECP